MIRVSRLPTWANKGGTQARDPGQLAPGTLYVSCGSRRLHWPVQRPDLWNTCSSAQRGQETVRVSGVAARLRLFADYKMVECNRTMDQARRDFSLGRLTGAMLVRVPMSKTEWTVRLSGKNGDAGMLLEVQTLGTRIFDSLDGAAQAIEQIGFSIDQLKVQ